MKNSKLSKIITAFFLFFSMVYPNYNILETVNVDSKINGFIVNLQLDSLPDQKNLSAWQANTGWFYITLYECRLEQKNNLKPKTNDEIISTMKQLREIGVSIFTIGQYLQPTKNHLKVERYVSDEEFLYYRQSGLELGFDIVESGSLVRSSYHADEQARLVMEGN